MKPTYEQAQAFIIAINQFDMMTQWVSQAIESVCPDNFVLFPRDFLLDLLQHVYGKEMREEFEYYLYERPDTTEPCCEYEGVKYSMNTDEEFLRWLSVTWRLDVEKEMKEDCKENCGEVRRGRLLDEDFQEKFQDLLNMFFWNKGIWL